MSASSLRRPHDGGRRAFYGWLRISNSSCRGLPEVWRDILGVDRFTLAEVISRETKETLDVAATCVWTSIECLKKAGAGMTAPLVFVGAATNGWILLASGELKIASCVIKRKGEKEDLAIALLTGAEMRAYAISTTSSGLRRLT